MGPMLMLLTLLYITCSSDNLDDRHGLVCVCTGLSSRRTYRRINVRLGSRSRCYSTPTPQHLPATERQE